MAGHMVIFGPGYCGSRIADALEARGWRVTRAGRDCAEPFADAPDSVLSTVPPGGDGDPVLARFGDVIRGGPLRWIGYLSSTGVYGDTGGAWVDETAPLKGRRGPRLIADQQWLELGAHVLRLPGIYGPGRSAIDRVAEGKAHRLDLPEQVFSRIHVADVLGGVLAALGGPAGAYNLSDDLPCSQNRVIEAAASLTGQAPPPMQSLEAAALSPAARAFYAENRRVANGKAKRVLGWKPRYPTYVEGLAACL